LLSDNANQRLAEAFQKQLSATGARATPPRTERVPSTGWRGSKRYGFRYPVSVEEILDVEPGKRLAYTVLRGIPVRNYRAEVTLSPSPDGTLIRWGASWWRVRSGRAAGSSGIRSSGWSRPTT
jgi:uncharacterized protein YndB with AHSA1/START domain